MELTRKQMQCLRERELALLRAFIEVCGKLGLRYFVVQGTLLGAVRHGGFIPWDDDIDVGMLREDYEIFLRQGQALLPRDFFIQAHGTDPAYPHGFAKLRDSDSAFVETTCKELSMHHGIFIDIFPFDCYPDGAIKQLRLLRKKLLLRYRIRQCLFIPKDRKLTAGNLARWVLMGLSRICYPELERALEAQERLYSSCRAGKRRINHGSPWGRRECVPKDWLEETVPMEFEGITVMAPKCWHAYLSHVYGDYMQLPPPEKRIPHHYISLIDFQKGYCPEMAQGIGDDRNI